MPTLSGYKTLAGRPGVVACSTWNTREGTSYIQWTARGKTPRAEMLHVEHPEGRPGVPRGTIWEKESRRTPCGHGRVPMVLGCYTWNTRERYAQKQAASGPPTLHHPKRLQTRNVTRGTSRRPPACSTWNTREIVDSFQGWGTGSGEEVARGPHVTRGTSRKLPECSTWNIRYRSLQLFDPVADLQDADVGARQGMRIPCPARKGSMIRYVPGGEEAKRPVRRYQGGGGGQHGLRLLDSTHPNRVIVAREEEFRPARCAQMPSGGTVDGRLPAERRPSSAAIRPT